jgi:hypothetical protein
MVVGVVVIVVVPGEKGVVLYVVDVALQLGYVERQPGLRPEIIQDETTFGNRAVNAFQTHSFRRFPPFEARVVRSFLAGKTRGFAGVRSFLIGKSTRIP